MFRRSMRVKWWFLNSLLLPLALAACNFPSSSFAVLHVGCDTPELIHAIDTANLSPGSSIITLAAGCTYNLTEINNNTDGHNGLPSIRNLIAISGSGAKISAAGTPAFRIFHVAPQGNLTLENLTVTNGAAAKEDFFDRNADLGGGIYNAGSLTVSNSTISDNMAQQGAGIYNLGQLSVINGSIISANLAEGTSGTGAGIFNQRGSIAIADSSIYDNRGDARGVGLHNFRGSATITNSQVIHNTAGFVGSGIDSNGTLEIFDSAIRDNTGEGIYNLGALRIVRSTISSNDRHGVMNGEGCPASIDGSIISENGAEHGINGGGILNDGVLTLTNTVLSANSADYGGGIFNEGELHMNDSTLSENHASMKGGAILNVKKGVCPDTPGSPCFALATPLFEPSGPTDESSTCDLETNTGLLSIDNSTLSGNTARGKGGGLFNGAGGMVAFHYSTASDNSARDGGGGVYDDSAGSGSLEFINSIVANSPSGGNCHNASGVLTATGANLASDGSCAGFTMTGDPILGPLQNNGGNTPTHGLLAGSPAIDAANGDCPGADQRGNTRPGGASCDIGSFEVSAVRPTPTALAIRPFPRTELPVTSPASILPTIIRDTLCWEGPGAAYGVVSSIQAGTLVTLLGEGAQKGWYVVDNPRYHDACWVPQENLNVPPGITSLRIYPVPTLVIPTNTSAPLPAPPQNSPAAPYKLYIQNHVCAGSTYTVTLAWQDKADNELGYRLYRNNTLIATLGTNSASYTDSPSTGGPYFYVVEAYNDAGAARSSSAKDDGCVF